MLKFLLRQFFNFEQNIKLIDTVHMFNKSFLYHQVKREGPYQGRKEVCISMDGRRYEKIVQVSSCNLVKLVRIEIKI